MEPSTKRCGGCRRIKSVHEFYFRDRERTLRQGYCRNCKGNYNRDWYQRNRRKHIQDVRRNNARYRQRLRDIVEPLKYRPCADCGVRFPPECMDFDHLGEDVKQDNISRLIGAGASVEVLLTEVAKCELVCSNCHRIRTTRRRERSGPASRRRQPASTPSRASDGLQLTQQMSLLDLM